MKKKITFKEQIEMVWTCDVIEMGEERIYKRMLHTKMEGKQPRGRPRTKWIDQSRKDIKIRRKKLGRNTRKWNRIEMARDLSVIVDP